MHHAADSERFGGNFSNKIRKRRLDDEPRIGSASMVMSNFEERLLEAQNRTVMMPNNNNKGRMNKTQRMAFFSEERPLGGNRTQKIRLQMPKRSKKKKMPKLFNEILKKPYDKKEHERLLLEEKAQAKKKKLEEEE